MNDDRPVILPFSPGSSTMRRPAILLTSYMRGALSGKNLGVPGYSYDFLTQRFMPLLERFGEVIPVPHPQQNLEAAARDARQRGLTPVHLSILPLQDVHLARSVPNVVFPAWEFPDVPDHPFDGNLQNDWPATANRCSLILVGGPFTAEVLRRAGTKTPIRIVPVPNPEEYFGLSPWNPGGERTIDCPCFVLPQEAPQRRDHCVAAKPAAPSWRGRIAGVLRPCARWAYKRLVRPRLSERTARAVRKAWAAGRAAWQNPPGNYGIASSAQLELSGIVYTSILNPFDSRKNWRDLLTGFLLALGDCEDATLVVKLINSDPDAVSQVLGYYKTRDIPHRCKLAFIVGYLSEEQLLRVAEASTYYLQASKAEGACLPLMNYLAAGRPGISPRHSAMTDYFDEEIGFVVDSHPEPAAWPHDPYLRVRTTWGRVVWSSLVDQIRQSYAVAKTDRATYEALAGRAQQRMRQWASLESVWPRLQSALEAALSTSSASEPSRLQQRKAAA